MKRFLDLSPVFLRCFALFLLGTFTAWISLDGSPTFAMPFPQDAAKAPSDSKPGDEAAADESGLKGLSEPDAKSLEVRDESDAIDPANKDALAWYMAGQKALKRGELEDAAEAFQKASDADPKSAVPVRALAMVLFRMNKVEEGLSKAQKAMQLDPDDFESRLEMAVLYGTNREFKESYRLLEEALGSTRLKKDSFQFVHIHQVRGAVLLEMQNLAGAADSYEIILAALERPEDFHLSDREHKTLLKNRLTGYEVTGRILMQAGRLPKAILAFEAMARTENDVPGEHNLLLARAYFQQDKLEACEQNLNRYFESGRRSKDSLLLLRDLYEATSRSDSLTSRLGELSAEASDAGAVRMFLGQILLDQGKTNAAADVYQSILDTTGEADAYLGLVRVEIANRNPGALIATLNRAARSRITVEEMVPLVTSVTLVDEFAKDAISTCRKMFAEKPGDLHPAVPYFCSLVAEKMELGEEEAALLKETLDLNPDQPLAMQTLDKYGMNQLKQGDYSKAAKIFEQMLSTPGLPPGTRVNTLFRISLAYASIQDLGKARKALQEALRMVPDEPQLLGRLALVEAADGKLEVAEKLLLRSIDGLQQNPELMAETRVRLAGIYAQLDQWDNAIEQYLFVMDIDSIDKGVLRLARMGLSNAYVQSGDMEKGEKVLEEIYEEDPTETGVNNDLGYLYADQGKNLEKAEQMIRIAVAAQPENPAYLDSLGWVLFKQGKNEEALEPLKKANSDPDYQDATLLEHQGDVHQALKQLDEAKALWKKAVEVEQMAKRPDKTVLSRLKEKLGESVSPEKSPKAATPEKN
jgi:tetratricopeptide (TPR) repeat protein